MSHRTGRSMWRTLSACRLTALLALSVWVSGSASAAQPSQPTPVIMRWRTTYQTIVGFGGTMGWIHPHEETKDEIFDLLFRELGVSVLRVRALGAEFDGERGLEDTNDNADPYTFAWDWLPIGVTERRNAAVIKAARERGVRIVIPTSWSPPAWMKDNQSRAGKGSLRSDVLEEFAELWAAYVIGMKREFDIDTTDISIQNEPDVYATTHATCLVDPDLYARAVARVEARMAKEKLDVRVLGPDTCHLSNMPKYLTAMAKAGVTSGVPALSHLYSEEVPYGDAGKDARRWRAARDVARTHKRPLWFMEVSNWKDEGTEHGSWDEALVWAQKIHHALVQGDCEVVCYWQLYFDKKGQALIYAAENGAKEYEITPKFYTSMNYYHLVRPGMVRVDAACADREILASAFQHPEKTVERRVVVVINTGGTEKTISLCTGMQAGRDNHDLTDKDGNIIAVRAGAPGQWVRYETTAKSKCELVEGRYGSPVLPPRSVTTFVWGQGLR